MLPTLRGRFLPPRGLARTMGRHDNMRGPMVDKITDHHLLVDYACSSCQSPIQFHASADTVALVLTGEEAVWCGHCGVDTRQQATQELASKAPAFALLTVLRIEQRLRLLPELRQTLEKGLAELHHDMGLLEQEQRPLGELQRRARADFRLGHEEIGPGITAWVSRRVGGLRDYLGALFSS